MWHSGDDVGAPSDDGNSSASRDSLIKGPRSLRSWLAPKKTKKARKTKRTNVDEGDKEKQKETYIVFQ